MLSESINWRLRSWNTGMTPSMPSNIIWGGGGGGGPGAGGPAAMLELFESWCGGGGSGGGGANPGKPTRTLSYPVGSSGGGGGKGNPDPDGCCMMRVLVVSESSLWEGEVERGIIQTHNTPHGTHGDILQHAGSFAYCIFPPTTGDLMDMINGRENKYN